jgi:hypothetical protein
MESLMADLALCHLKDDTPGFHWYLGPRYRDTANHHAYAGILYQMANGVRDVPNPGQGLRVTA